MSRARRYALMCALALPVLAAAGSPVLEKARLDAANAAAELDRHRTERDQRLLRAGGEVRALEGEVAALRLEIRALREAREHEKRAGVERREQAGELNRAIAAMNASARALAALRPAETDGPPVSGERKPDQWAHALDAELLALCIGRDIPGRAVLPDGRVVEGRWLERGPLHRFASASGGAGGLSRERGFVEPAALEWTGAPPAEPGGLWADVTGGRAIASARRERGWIAHLRAGGALMLPLGAVALLAALLILAKAAALLRLRARDPAAVEQVASLAAAGNLDAARTAAAGAPAPLREVLEAGVRHHQASPELLEEVLHERILAGAPALEQHLGMISVLGGVAPLLGLLGTVTGMIHTFHAMSAGPGRDTGGLSAGIAEALITTEAGLVIAIPVLLLHALLSRRVRSLTGDLELAAVAFANRLREGPR